MPPPALDRVKLETGLARDILFVSSASRICELKKLRWIFQIRF